MARRISEKDWLRVGQSVVAEFRRRQDDKKRKSLEAQWKEIDRQVRMEAKPRVNKEAEDDSNSWMSEIEMPDQASTLNDTVSEFRRLLFGEGEDWYKAHAVYTDDLGERIQNYPFIHGDRQGETPGTSNQDNANLIVKSGLDHFHGLYNFRDRWDALGCEAVKYGTYVYRSALVNVQAVAGVFRNIKGPLIIPMMIPLSIKNTYIEDRAQYVMMEGTSVRPAHIRHYWQHVDDLKRAAKNAKRREDNGGWIAKNVEKCEGIKDHRDHVELIEYEGDLIIPRSQGPNIVEENQIVTVDLATGLPVRVRDSKLPFCSYHSDVYQRDDADSPYGASPLMKGRPLQELASEAAARVADAAALDTDPTVVWDTGDSKLQAKGGPMIAPGNMVEVDNVEGVKTLDVGDPTALFGIMVGARAMYQESLKRQEPRGSGQMKSHTTAYATDAALSRGILPTEDFVDQVRHGSMKSWLHMEFVLAREALRKRRQTVLVSDRGNEVHMDISPDVWPEGCDFTVMGALGSISKREELQNFLVGVKTQVELEQVVVQLGGAPTDFDELRREMWRRLGVTDSERFFRKPEGLPGESQGEPNVPPDLAAIAGAGPAAA